MTELLEVYTAGGQPTGIVKSRDDVHAAGDWHLAAFVWIHDPAGRILLQRRALDKATYPGRWDASCAGHVDAGEDVEAAARRELGEELGLNASFLKLRRLPDHREEHVHANGIVDREHHAVFLLPCELTLEGYAFGPEVIELGFAPLPAFTAYANGEADTLSIDGRVFDRDAIVPYGPGYLARIAGQVSF